MKNKSYKDIKTLDDALKATGRPATPAFADLPEDMREHFQRHYEAIVITEAINGEWKADWNNSDQKKWLPWFWFRPSGFALYDTCYNYSFASAGDASRLCFETEEQARYAGETFPEIYEGQLTK